MIISMDRQDQTTDGKFEGGIFSRTVMGENRAAQDLQENRYFDNALGYVQGAGEPLEELPEEEKNSEEPEIQGESKHLEEPKFREGTEHLEEPEFRGDSKASENLKFSEEPKAAPYHDRGECGSCRCRNCPNRQKQGQTVLFIISLTAVAALAIAFLAAVFGLVIVSLWKSGQPAGGVGNSVSNEKGTYFEAGSPKGIDSPKGESGNKYWEGSMPGAGNGGEYYGEITDAVRTDLDYSIQWENYEYEGNNDNVTIAVDYPVIEGNIPNREAINDIIDDETEYFEEYYKEYSKYMMPEESFLVYSEGYVTFMDPEIMSVVFCEMIYTDYWADYGLYCLNIDVENGVVLDNNSIMDINDEFVVDFRKRCRQQNGTVSDLDSMTDQEIVYYLTSGGTSILFYTPLGMEVGLNMGEYYVTVTYKDYEEFLQKY